jgi:hypothetical protein
MTAVTMNFEQARFNMIEQQIRLGSARSAGAGIVVGSQA